MAVKGDLRNWLVDALRQLGGSGTVVEVSQAIWEKHELELRSSGSLLFTWQYDLRWAALELRKDGTLTRSDPKVRKWMLANH